MVLSREWRNGFLGLLLGTLRDYHKDPFSHSLLRTRELRAEGLRTKGFLEGSGRRGGFLRGKLGLGVFRS